MKTIKITKETLEEGMVQFKTELEQILNNSDADSFVSNGLVTAILESDVSKYKFFGTNFLKEKKYIQEITTMFGKKLCVDAMQMWNDNKIHLKKGDDIIDEILIEDENDIILLKCDI